MKTNFIFLICLIITINFVSVSSAGTYNSTKTAFIRSSGPSTVSVVDSQNLTNSSVSINFAVKVGESWDALNDSNNLITNCVTGDAITGIEWHNVAIETSGGSWLSDASILISDSNNSQGVELAIGQETRYAGIGTYTSAGVLDFTDEGVNDIIALADKTFPIQFFEEFDDVTDSIEAYFTAGTITLWGENLSASQNCEFIAGIGEASDLEVTLESDAVNNLRINDAITFTSTISNVGNATAANIIITDTLTGLTFIDASCDNGSVGTYADSLVTITTDSIAVGASLLCTINTTVSSFGELSYSTSVLADNEPSVDSNNFASLTLVRSAITIPINNWMFLIILFIGILFFVSNSLKNSRL